MTEDEVEVAGLILYRLATVFMMTAWVFTGIQLASEQPLYRRLLVYIVMLCGFVAMLYARRM